MLISVILPAYNAELYLKMAIDSILNQTFSDFELIVINDGSNDETENIILEYNDPRIVYIKNEKNIGLIETLNKGLALSKGKYIARMDADDISLPDRFMKQVNFLENHTDYVICSSSALSFIGENLNQTKYLYMPISDSSINVRCFFNSPFVHPAVMMRKSILIENKLFFQKEHKYAEDYGLWVKLLKFGKGYNFSKPLIYYRILENSQSAIGNERIEERFKILNLIHEINLKNKGILFNESQVGKLFYLSKIDRIKMIDLNSDDLNEYFEIFNMLYFEVKKIYKQLDALMALGRFYVMFIYVIFSKNKIKKYLFKINFNLLILGTFDYLFSKIKSF